MGYLIFYQDTDSMHIRAEDVHLLAEEFKKKYGYELIGDELTQFHFDFDDECKNDPDAYSDRFIINGKKHYIDRVWNGKDTAYKFHVRCKDITGKAIEKKAGNNDLMTLYKNIYDGDSVVYDLVESSPKFQMNKDLTIFSKERFLRKVRRLVDKGDWEKYMERA